MAGDQEGILEHRLSPADGPEKEQIQGVLDTLEAEPESIDDRDELPGGNRRRRETPEEQREPCGMATSHPLTADAAAGRVLTEAGPSAEHAEGTQRVSA